MSLQHHPISALHTLDSERVIYVGTFSKILYPALRIGYAVMPKALVDTFSRVKHLEDIHTPVMEQLTLARFMEEGLLERHIRKARKCYEKKNRLLQQSLTKSFGERVTIVGDQAGIHLVARFTELTFDSHFYNVLHEKGLKLSPVEPLRKFPELHRNELMIGYGHLSEEAIVKGVDILSEVIDGQ